jgi:N-acetyl-anhydromuramyl-L-alanine amidase AmpD
MLFISKEGHVDSERIVVRIFPSIERGAMGKVNGIVVHQTSVATSSSTFNSYRSKGANGAHFLIDKDGLIYQTASLKKHTNHVGRLQSRSVHEHKKPFPLRFPSNTDSIGIEIVGLFIAERRIYEAVNPRQNESLAWLVRELAATLKVSMQEVYRHPVVARKMESEAESAKW